MSLEDLKTVLLIQSIENLVYSHRSEIQKHEKRVTFVLKQKDDALLIIENSNKKLQCTQKVLREQEVKLNALEKELSTAKDHILDITNEKQQAALEAQINSLSPQIESIEESMLEHLEAIDEINEVIKNKTIFSNGILESIDTIKEEVDSDCKKENKEIDLYIQRRKNLLETIVPNLRGSYLSLKKRYKELPAVAYLKSNCCSRCGLEVDNQKISSLETQYNIENCTGCGRIFIPQSAKS